jgi:hypothetical protein
MRRLAPALAVLLLSAPASGRVERLEVLRRGEVAGGKPFGAAGPYEKIVGRLHLQIDPADPHNRAIVDLPLAPRNARGAVELWADVVLLAPTDPARGNGTLLLEVPNRGGKGILAIANRARRALDPQAEADFGDGFLMNRGYVVGWVGWQWDVRDDPQLLRLQAPVASDRGRPIRGLVRSDFTVPAATREQPLGHVIGGTLGGVEYEAADPASRDNVLTVRDSPLGPRRPVERAPAAGGWSFAREERPGTAGEPGRLLPDRRTIHLPAGFQPGKIYELIYLAEGPRVAGLGFAAVRDLVAHLKHDPGAALRVRTALGVGISQTGRFLRHFLHEGFNADEAGRKVFDGLIPHVAGAGRGNFNHRFAQPSRDAQPLNAILYATDLYPFADLPLRDPVTGRREGLLDRALASKLAPRIFHTNTSYEYWSRAASLIHTTPDGAADAPLPDNVRVYAYPGLQHYSGPFPPEPGRDGERSSLHRQSPLAVAWFWRSMIVALEQWVNRDTPPPASRYPRIADGTLVRREALAFPEISRAIAGAAPPADVHQAYRTDFGPQFARGIVTRHPPLAGRPFVSLVPQVDADGNELAGIRLPELVAPVATYTGWNFRAPSIGFPTARVSFLGSYFPFPSTPEIAGGDPRRSIAERYRDRDAYLGAFTRHALSLVRDRYLLAEDLPIVLELGLAAWRLTTPGQPSANP